MSGASFTKEAAARYAGTTVEVVESFIRAGVVRVIRRGGQTIVTEEGLRALREHMARIRADVTAERAGGAGGSPSSSRAGRHRGPFHLERGDHRKEGPRDCRGDQRDWRGS